MSEVPESEVLLHRIRSIEERIDRCENAFNSLHELRLSMENAIREAARALNGGVQVNAREIHATLSKHADQLRAVERDAGALFKRVSAIETRPVPAVPKESAALKRVRALEPAVAELYARVTAPKPEPAPRLSWWQRIAHRAAWV